MNALLTIQRDGQVLKSQPLEQGELLLGRGEGCVVRLEDRAVSRQHAVLRSSASGLSIERKSPLAPLFVNGAECDAALLKEGDEIHIGPFVLKISSQRSENSEPALAKSTEAMDSLQGVGEPALEIEAATRPETPAEASSVPQLEGVDGPSDESAPDPILALLGDGAVQSAPLSPQELDVSQIAGSDAVEVPQDAKTAVLGSSAVKLKVRITVGNANIQEVEFDKEEVSIGRGKGCDVVVKDKKASRKHALINRSGQGALATYRIVDLQSANGTYVNGAKVTEHVLSGDDVVRIGDVEMVIQSVSPGFTAKAAKFLKLEEPISSGLQPEPEVQLFGAADPSPELPFEGDGQIGFKTSGSSVMNVAGVSGVSNFPGIPGISSAGSGSAGPSLIDKFQALPPARRFRVALIGLLGVFALFTFLEETPTPKKKSKKSKAPAAAASGVPVASQSGRPQKVLPSFAELTPDLQKFVDSQYNLSMEYFRNRDFDRALYEIDKIFQYVAEYKDATDLKRYSIEGKQRLAAQEEERKRKEAERQVRERVAQLVLEIEGHMSRKEYDRARDFFSEVIAIDPENQQIAEWKKVIQQYEDEQREAELRNRLIRETNERASGVIATGDLQRKEGKWIQAIETYESALALEPQDKKVIERAQSGIRKAKQGLKSAVEPLIAEGRELESQSEFAKAFASYEKARQVDPQSKEAVDGLQRVRGILSDQIRALYTEAVLAESYSDFAQAKAKFEQIVATAPKDDLYYERARRKLSKYVIQEEPKIE
ncbi:MAG: FHA domain-containing protein [Oligoflexia bacterium]